jgi:hypothetical protein
MKLHDFGLWFHSTEDEQWSTSIPQQKNFEIWFCGEYLGEQKIIDEREPLGCRQIELFTLAVLEQNSHIIQLKDPKIKKEFCQGIPCFKIGRPLTIDDFDIIPSPYCVGLWFRSQLFSEEWFETIPRSSQCALLFYNGWHLATITKDYIDEICGIQLRYLMNCHIWLN